MPTIEKLDRKAPVRFTADLKNQFLEIYRNHPDLGGRKTLCCLAVGVGSGTVASHLKSDPIFKELFEEAQQGWIEENLFTPALARAKDGVERPIIGGQFRDEVVATEKVYSDAIMRDFLKAYIPQFSTKDQPTGIGGVGQGGVVAIPTAPGSIHEWQEKYSEAAKGKRPE